MATPKVSIDSFYFSKQYSLVYRQGAWLSSPGKLIYLAALIWAIAKEVEAEQHK
jgi:hypothetical protein